MRMLTVETGYIANFGYTDGSGDYYLTVDTDTTIARSGRNRLHEGPG